MGGEGGWTPKMSFFERRDFFDTHLSRPSVERKKEKKTHPSPLFHPRINSIAWLGVWNKTICAVF